MMSLVTFSKWASSYFREIKILCLISLYIWLQHNHKSEDTIFGEKISRTDLVLSECALQNNTVFLEWLECLTWECSSLYFHFFINYSVHFLATNVTDCSILDLQNNRIGWHDHNYPCWGGVRHLGQGHIVVWKNDGLSNGSFFDSLILVVGVSPNSFPKVKNRKTGQAES